MISALAQELNDVLAGTAAGDLLSDMGKRLYFPKGIIAQSGEAKKLGKTANATIGMTVINGSPVTLQSIQDQVPSFSSRELVAYAPTAGNPDLRALWKNAIIKKNPRLENIPISMPVLVPGLTAGISYLADLFLDESKGLVASDPSWDNYVLIASARRNASFVQFPMFKDGKFNIDALEEKMSEEAKSGSVRVLLNFPQNPSGYSPTTDEVKRLVEFIKGLADKGVKVMVWCDDAYFGLAYEKEIERQSLFAYLADLSPNVLAAKIDGPTKEDFAWGFRAGFLTFGSKGMIEEQYDALIRKLMGIIRSSVSCGSTPAQSIMIRTINNPKIEGEKEKIRAILEERYTIVRNFVNERRNNKVLTPLPFNSGYFMCFKCNGIDAEDLRYKLLHEYQIGTIALGSDYLRIAFSSIDSDQIEEVHSTVYKAAEELA